MRFSLLHLGGPLAPTLVDARDAAAGAGPVDAVRVLVRDGYQPETVFARAGRPLRITFRREESAFCSERVIFPALGKSVMLPPHRDVTVELLLEQPGEYEFSCQLGILRGRLVVSGSPLPGRESTSA